jgi:Protein of unknown function (DUF2778)
MVYVAATKGEAASRAGISLPGKIAVAVVACAAASFSAALIAGFDPTTWITADLPPATGNTMSFNDRFVPQQPSASVDASARQLVQSWSSELELKMQQAKSRLAQRLQSGNQLPQDFRTAMIDAPKPVEEAKPVDEPKPAAPVAISVPLPKARPSDARQVDAKIEEPPPPPGASSYARADDRSLFQKLSDFTGKITMASLGSSETGTYHDAPDLSTYGYDKQTAVYDITAHAVYLPNGIRLEAHSGMGNLMDDPDHVGEKMVGATPPATYDLKPREKLFHGVPALRMNPQDASAALGRSGLLTHPFMLGPRGDSNGCVSIKNYDLFIKAYNDGMFTRLVVLRSLNGNGNNVTVAHAEQQS